jgi:hypothetical protein
LLAGAIVWSRWLTPSLTSAARRTCCRPTSPIRYIVTRERRVAVNEMLIRAGDQTW